MVRVMVMVVKIMVMLPVNDCPARSSLELGNELITHDDES